MRWMGILIAMAAVFVARTPEARAEEPPMIPIGLDAYRMWDRWAYQRIGARAYMRSTYDRRGGNEAADASHFLYQLADDQNVTLDVEGPGVLYFVRTNHWHGSPWHYVVDGTDHIVQETSTADPDHPVENSVFMPQELFPNPLTWTWSITKGADLMWVPIPFEKSFRLAYARTRYGTGYYIWHHYVGGANLSQPIRSWDGKTPPDAAVLELINRAGTDLAPDTGSVETGSFDLGTGESLELPVMYEGPAMLRAIKASVPKEHAVAFGKARLRITWDDRPAPSVDAPIALFFGTGTLYNRDGREYLVKGFPMNVRYDDDRVHLACYYPMPFFRSARFEVVGGPADVRDVRWEARWEPYRDPRNHVGYFHATYRDHPEPKRGHDIVCLDSREVEGIQEWSGQFVGMSWIFSHRAVLNTLEGDPRFFFDDSQTPQCYGTGTEEWGGGGDYWGGRNMTLPFAGHPVGARKAAEAADEEDQIESAYRFLLADLMPFGRNAVIRLEHGGMNQSSEHYETVVYWYGLPAASLVQTDVLDVGDPESEKTHAYASPDASEVVEITSRYEWGVDTFKGEEIYPAHTDRGRFTKGTSEFTLKLRPENLGVLLRRKLDYAFPNQRAEVYVAGVSDADTASPSRTPSQGRDRAGSAEEDAETRGRGDAERKLEWKLAGIWYLAGSNTCVYSNPKPELGATEHHVQTSNRRFRDDEFLIPRDLTEGRSAIRVRVKFTPVERPLFPGHPLPDLAWSEIRYTAYCFVMPSFKETP